MLTIAAFAISIVSLMLNIYLIVKTKKISVKVITKSDVQENIKAEVQRSWGNLINPNSFESKQIKRGYQMPKRR
ncbi:hypothetical protein [Psychrobacter sp. JB193]|uniref:hypothetical protein n=1 Tax=Psychrobacter sp. JB193 TaxID=2024406 RepID=UPI000BAAA576|nr:hypothetical protein [Psychrobacter sp. JB193]PAT63918.1 hypothetical protein CIK80_02060 [Psychrobacter sp. JB193]